ncbi:retinoic acid early-inducible protein 1-epsilon-like [Microtus pennsylvanicus]|uniref:retinoic acid early-inducible protein 1-epsilon-like n=1 Tax=Microtus pennsylvanicus TaxID=10058 RepID=UPI003F6AB77F
MAKNAAAQHCLSTLAVCFSVLLICLWSMLPADAHSLTCDFIVKARTTPGQSWCEGWCSVHGEPYLQYDNDNKATPLGDLGKVADATPVLTDLMQKLEYLGQELRKMLANSIQELTETSGQPTLQATMLSQYEQGQTVGASWRFNISGKYSFILDTMNMSFKQISLEARSIMNDEQLMKDLKIISTADCSYWLKELLKHQKKNQRSTSRASGITLPTSASATQPQLTTNLQYEEVFVTIAAVIAIILTLFVGIVVKHHPQGGASPCCSSASSSII